MIVASVRVTAFGGIHQKKSVFGVDSFIVLEMVCVFEGHNYI